MKRVSTDDKNMEAHRKLSGVDVRYGIFKIRTPDTQRYEESQ